MRRRCDGRDVNLVMHVNAETGERVVPDHKTRRTDPHKPCDCGLVFDDADRLTYWPHDRL